MFLLVSDDMKWTKMNIYSRARSHYNIFLAGNGNGENVDAVGNLFYITSLGVNEITINIL